MVERFLPATFDALPSALTFIEKSMEEHHYNRKTVQEAMMLSEESIISLIQVTEPDSELHIHIKFGFGLAHITLSVPGTPLESIIPFQMEEMDSHHMGRSTEQAVRALLLQAYETKLQYSRKGRYNFIQVTAGERKQVTAVESVIAFVAAMLIGLLLTFLLPDSWKNALDANLFLPAQTIFLNTLKLMTAPLVFFSIISNIERFSSFSDPGKVGIRSIIIYLCTSILAVCIGYGAFQLIRPGVPGLFGSMVNEGVTSLVRTGFVDTIVNIVPESIIAPFFNNDTLQLIFFALLVGLSAARVNRASSKLHEATDTLGTLFSRMAAILSTLTPYAVFFSTLSMIVNFGYRAFLSLLAMIGVLAAALLCLVAVYMLMLLLRGLNPFIMLRKYFPTLVSAFLSGSEIGTINKTMRCCRSQLGVSNEIYSFTIPFGSIANMDGNCVYMIIAELFIMRLCGIEMQRADILPTILMVVILSVGAPLASGSELICLTVLLGRSGISVGALCILLGINAGVELVLAMLNILGDVATTLCIAKSEKLLNMEVYLKKTKKTMKAKKA